MSIFLGCTSDGEIGSIACCRTSGNTSDISECTGCRTLLDATSADDSKTRGWVEVDDAFKLRSASTDCNTLPSSPMLASSVRCAARRETAALAAPAAALAAAVLARRGRCDAVAGPRELDGSRTPSWNFSRRPRLGFFSFGNVLCFRDDTFANG